MTAFFGLGGGLWRQYASQTAGLAAVIIAAAVLIGWWGGLPLLSSWASGFPAMRPSGVLPLAALGLALVHPGKNYRIAFAVGLAVAAIAALGLILVLFSVDLSAINRWLAPGYAVPPPSLQFQGAEAVSFGLAGGSLALGTFERHRVTATMLSGIVGTIAVFALLGYLAGIDTLYGSVSVNSPPLPDVVSLFCIAGGIILRIGTMPVLRRPRPLWHLLVVLGSAIVVPLLLFGAYAGFRIAEAQFHDVREDLAIEARALSANVDSEIIGEIERLQALAASPSLRHGDFAEFQRQAEASLAMRQSGNIVLIDRNMQQIVNTLIPFGKPLPKTAAQETVERAITTGTPQVTGLFIGPVTGQSLFGIIVPVKIDGENRYALFRSPDQHALARRLVVANELPTGWQAQAVVSDATHRIIARSQEDSFIGKELPPSQWHRAGASSVFEFIDSDGRSSLEAYARSELTGWETAVWAPTALLEAPVRAQWRILGLTALLALTLVVFFASWLGRIIARSVGHAADTAIPLGKGGPMPPSRTPIDEINTLIMGLRESADLLRKSKDRLQLAMDAARLGSFQYDARRHVFSGDARVKEIFDFDSDQDEVGLEEFVKRIYPNDVARFWAAREAVFNPADSKPYANEYRIQRRDGEVRWVEILGRAYFEGVGPERRAVTLVGTAADITERKEREEKERLLMREISHRAKNMLSVVHSIAQQTATRSPEDFVESFSERIQALAASQDLLIRNEWNGVEIKDLAKTQLAHFTDLIGRRIILHGPILRFNPASAQAIGLALHELATNAAKYGALSTDTGRVDIGWGTDGRTLTMSWSERDGPLVSAPKRRGFGTLVIEAMAERSLDGKVDLDFLPTGVTWQLTCPAANALEPGERSSSFEDRKNRNDRAGLAQSRTA
jgi:two-component sensor histidine kinase/PAS domain-containing protein